MLAGGNGTLGHSGDGHSWVTRRELFPTLFDVTYAQGEFVVVGVGGAILVSSDGASFTQRDSQVSNDLRGVAFGGGTFVAVGADSIVLTSPDTETWTHQ